MKRLVQCPISAGRDEQILWACFRHKSPCVPFFPRHAHINAMSGCSLTSNCRAESFIPSDLTVENQMNSPIPRFVFHRDDRDGLKKCSSLQGDSASTRIKMSVYSQSLPNLPPCCDRNHNRGN